MKERPILFNGPMVRALLDGSKTQTRRIAKLPHQNPLGVWESFDWGGPNGGRTAQGETVPAQKAIAHTRTGEIICCPYGQPGDRVWVRETWQRAGGNTGYWHRATDDKADDGNSPVSSWRPSIHMPRAASRITLEIVSVRVERLQDISHSDAMAEGMAWDDAVFDYRTLWESINGPGSWDANPWVWVVEFKNLQS